jgi:hypothetical protein
MHNAIVTKSLFFTGMMSILNKTKPSQNTYFKNYGAYYTDHVSLHISHYILFLVLSSVLD